MSYSTQKVTITLLDEIKRALHRVAFGSIEIFVQDNIVTQITVRNIKKTRYKLNGNEKKNGKPFPAHAHVASRKANRANIQVLTIDK